MDGRLMTDKCDHNNIDKSGQMRETPVEGVYVIPMYCNDCCREVFEKYYYEGIIEDEENPED
jgi:hypothetical protein|tara:strand:+ start:286 stop:471 length:186 start_codon:yes stop_codon:yes gene_type:complete